MEEKPVEPVMAAAVVSPEPEPAEEPEEEWNPAPAPQLPVAPLPVAAAPTAAEPTAPSVAASAAPEPAASEPAAPKGSDWPSPVPIPAWAPRIPAPAEPTTSHPGTPTWFSPKDEVRHTSQQIPQPVQPAAPAPQPQPQPQPQPAPASRQPVAAQPAPTQPQQPSPAAKGSWQVVEQQQKADRQSGITPEDRSYAEWFAWAKRGGAPASACHAAAQGAFAALTTGKDVATAVQWATAAMSRPPENVSYERQTYCAWFSLANIDLNLDGPRSHAFAAGAIAALDAGMDASAAHAAGLAAAGIR